MNSIQKTKVEECWVLIGQRREGVWIYRRRRYSIGKPTTVAFDARWTLNREEATEMSWASSTRIRQGRRLQAGETCGR